MIRPEAISISSTVLAAEAMELSARVTAIAAMPSADPLRPASTVPEPRRSSAAANRATVEPLFPASFGSAPPVTITARFPADTCPSV